MTPPEKDHFISEGNHPRHGLRPCLGFTIVNHTADEYWDWDLKPQELDGSTTEAKLLSNKRYPTNMIRLSRGERFLCKAHWLWSLWSGAFPANLKVMTVMTLYHQSIFYLAQVFLVPQKTCKTSTAPWPRNQISLRKISINRTSL